jgi:hypothetical protein
VKHFNIKSVKQPPRNSRRLSVHASRVLSSLVMHVRSSEQRRLRTLKLTGEAEGVLNAPLVGAEHRSDVLHLVPLGPKQFGGFRLGFVEASPVKFYDIQKDPGLGVSEYGHGFSFVHGCERRQVKALNVAGGAADRGVRRLHSGGDSDQGIASTPLIVRCDEMSRESFKPIARCGAA